MNRIFALFLIIALASYAQAENAAAGRSWLPKHYSVPDYTLSPNGCYGVMMPYDMGSGADNKLVEMRTGRVVAVMAGEYGWAGPNPSMRWGPMTAVWSADGSTLCWIYPGKWFPDSYVVLKLCDGKLGWQIELMKPVQREILTRTEAAAPQNFAAAKLDNAGNGSAYPEGFTIDVSIPAPGFSLPLACKVSLTSNSKVDEVVENGVQAFLTATIAENGTVSYSRFSVKRGNLSREKMKEVEAARQSYPLIDTDIGKAILFNGMISPDGRYAVGWTVRPALKGLKPVEWSRWDKENPDKLLRNYDWQDYSEDGPKLPYNVANFVIDLHSGKTLELSSKMPYWPGKRMGWALTTVWIDGLDGKRCALVQNSDGEGYHIGNFWLVSIDGEGMRDADLAPAMRKAVNGILKERRPVVLNPNDYLVAYKLETDKESGKARDCAEVPFVAQPNSSGMRGLGLKGMVTLSLSDGTVTQVASNAKRIDPFVDNEELRRADERLNAAYQAALKRLSPRDAAVLKQKQRTWIEKRDNDADIVAMQMPYTATEEACERAREKSLLESTKARERELNLQIRAH